MSDIEKLLTEAGFVPRMFSNGREDKTMWLKRHGPYVDRVELYADGGCDVSFHGPSTDLPNYLHPAVGLTAEERKHLTETLADMTNEATAMQLEGRLHSFEQVSGWANTLNNLLTRSTSDTVSLMDVGTAVESVMSAVNNKRNGWSKAGREAAEQALEMFKRRLTCSDDVIPPLTTEEMLHQVNEALHVFRRKGREGKLVWDSDDCALWEDVAETIVKRLIHFSDGCVSLTDVEEVVRDNVRAWCDGNQTIHWENVGDFVNDIIADLTSKREGEH